MNVGRALPAASSSSFCLLTSSLLPGPSPPPSPPSMGARGSAGSRGDGRDRGGGGVWAGGGARQRGGGRGRGGEAFRTRGRDAHPPGPPFLIRPPTFADKRACRMLLPRATGAGQRAQLHVAVSAPDGRVVGAAALGPEAG